MNRTSILRLALPIAFALGFVVACGPRMKPVEYEEPSKNLGGDTETVDDGSSVTSSASTSSADKGSDKASDDAPAPATAGGSCKDKRCGQSCSDCAPGDENCMEILILKQCNLKGECVPAKVECSAGDKDSKAKDGKSKDGKSKDAK